MWWIALVASLPEGRPPATPDHDLGWWALTYTPRVTRQGGAVLMELQASCRLFGGRQPLQQRLQQEARQLGSLAMASAPNATAALALLRHAMGSGPADEWRWAEVDEATLAQAAQGWRLSCMDAAAPHLDTLQRLGCQTVGDLLRLPRAGLTRRFGRELPDALDQLLGRLPTAHRWIALPDTFDQRLELPGRIDHAPGMAFAARRLLQALGLWLQARQAGMTHLTLHWQHDVRRQAGGPLADWGQLDLRSSAPTRDIAHLERVLAERLAQLRLCAPAVALRLQLTAWAPLPDQPLGLLPDAVAPGAERWPQLLERLVARLGADRVRCGHRLADHRPGSQQAWTAWTADQPARPTRAGNASQAPLAGQAPWQPTWLVEQPQVPCAGTPVAGPWRTETGWWDTTGGAQVGSRYEHRVLEHPHHGLVWAGRDLHHPDTPWYIHGYHG